ncbi:T9SS type A sorting domain-containing protein [Lacibacter cauensis]|uniref:T9SS type A sorting domain-containing protein n=1 Tax=Lacibacter cauensis TaxID=510947 RepID=UPI0011A6AE27|nr:T9SS type A sorting domain-containing protein [Lacibacter cauensis]
MKPFWLISFCLSLTAFFHPFKSRGQTISGIINSYYKATAIIDNGTFNSASYDGITLQSIAGLSTGDRVLIIQMKGATISSTDNSSFGNISAIGNAGNYEFSSICGFLNNTIVLSNHLLNTYDVANVQVIRVPVYTDVTISGTLLAQEWDPVTETGGVIAFEASGTVTMNANIRADSAGFKGGPLFRNTSFHCGPQSSWYYGLSGNQGAPKGEGIATFIANKEYGRGRQSNGGGGGNEDNTGGGGGANYATGGNGGNKIGTCSATVHGEAGLALNGYGYSNLNNRVFLGGAGGNGESNNDYGGASVSEGTPGGDGGGLIFIKANEIIGNGFTVSANGMQGVNPGLPVATEAAGDGGGGGGGAGAVMLEITTYTGNLILEARGANGSNAGFQTQCPGPGGGGGGGVIWTTSTLPANVTTSVAGGAAGIIKSTSYDPPCEGSSNGATAGANGVVQTGFVAPQGTNTISCAILPLDLLKQFTGKRNSQHIQLNWSLINADQVKKVVLEKKTGSTAFVPVTEKLQPALNGFYDDERNTTPVTYRLLLFALDGTVQHSKHLFFNADKQTSFNLYPNPAQDKVTVQLPVNTKGKTFVAITDVNGKLLLQKELLIQPAQTTFELSVKHLPIGIYQVRLVNNAVQFTTKLLKQ